MREIVVFDEPDKPGLWIHRGEYHEHGTALVVIQIGTELRVIVGDYPYPVNRYPGTWEYVPTNTYVTDQHGYFEQFSAVE